MLTLQSNARILIYTQPMDMRKGFEGLSDAVEHNFKGELTSGAYFVFLNRRRNRMKVLYWDSDGLALWYKRLEKGTYRHKYASHCSLTRREFLMLLEGIEPKRLLKRYLRE